VSKTICRQAASFAAGILFTVNSTQGAELTPKFLGANSCANSSCHGGGGEKQNQFLVWSQKDFHSQRPAATLTTARAKQIADALEIKDATADTRCTICHAPLHEVPENLRGENFKISEGVSCESCHGPAENWLRSHTRTDYTRADRTAAGMHDLQNLYVRANTCVACHQNVDADILKTGHPELIFELDGQSVAEPKHWSAEKNGNGAQAWLVGQAVALREMSWQLMPEQINALKNSQYFTNALAGRNSALSWLLHSAVGPTSITNFGLPRFPNDFSYTHDWADKLALETAVVPWSEKMTRDCLTRLANLAPSFSDSQVSQSIQARRAERLVLALDRLVAASPELKNNGPVQSSLNQLFKLAQSIPDFDPKQFAGALEKFSDALAAPP
jgi:Cytochrome c554 and c-prime